MGVLSERIHVQHNSIRPEPAVSAREVHLLRRKLGLNEGERMILAVGRLSKEKAQIDLLRAFKRLIDTHPGTNARLVIVGDGPERRPLAEVVASLSLGDHVIFAGQVNNVGATRPQTCL